MKLCDIAKMKINDEYNWQDFDNHHYCGSCRKIFHSWKESTGSKYCPDCLGEMMEITYDMIRASSAIKDNKPLVFTNEERKEIFDDWKKHIKSIPTPEQYYMKNYMRQKRSKPAFQTIS